MKILDPQKPAYGSNYGAGWIGFVAHDSFLARGIKWFTRHWRVQTPGVSHVFVVIGDNQCIEANGSGVEIGSLDEYFLASQYTCYLRRPAGWTPDLGARIAEAARQFDGRKYDYDLIAVDAVNYSLVGRLLNRLTRGAIYSVMSDIASSDGEMICDQLAALALQAQPELRPLLNLPAAQNNPQRLFGDDNIFAPEVTMIKGGPVNVKSVPF